MDQETIQRLIAEWREQSDYCWGIGDHGGGRAWAAAADKLEEELNA